MKQQWSTLAAKVDALSVRERVMCFGAAAALLIFLLFFMLLDPMLSKQKMLANTIEQQHQAASAIDIEVAEKIAAHASDPSLQDRIKLERLQQETAQMRRALQTTQEGLVAPERIVFLLQHLLKQHKHLRLVSLKTLPSSIMGQGGASLASAPATVPASAPAATPASPASAAAVPLTAPALLHRHGVEVVLQGGYLELVNYMDALEAMPSHVYWGKANLLAGHYPDASLTLTLYTLSLDEKWIAL
ncbi:hypothetical protein [Janthinobacterium agaricidamnosum]|uniref:MSHA biogenesis protein MshJ n=1 Tax=Janthinobacterium agaricidamnosum NBRC 102515 = DSM 9628 TaxID=1349767 RepID=W0V661_9BURK|nr:hypothetical protein [Janthinobacterium agaricidamnosum]CDG82757.1 putative uncharacterized protein [Janthinobacterium agaricidamnosum NBRC 102515 = DSM 9628]